MPKSKEASLDELMETRRDKMTMNEESYSEINRNKLENRLDIVDNDWRATEFKEKRFFVHFWGLDTIDLLL